ncbi:MAG: RNA polymerase sigma factor [Ignavibacteriaceae bacterium]|nr:RNA polymerase sigma factor [Ignavibacteriaceae bacterium]
MIKHYKNKVFNYAIYIMKNQMDAEDVTQEVLIRTWQNIDKFNFNAAKAWMMRTTHNLCIDYLRKNNIFNKRKLDVNEDYYVEFADRSINGNPSTVAESIITEEGIREAINNLPERFKSPFILYELQGFKYKEISKILDVPLNTIKVNILRARKQLQKDLKEYAK